jgi:copper(I)-binding protein
MTRMTSAALAAALMLAATQSFAPSIRLVQLAQAQSETSWRVGSMTITAAWTRATPRSAPVAGGFLKVTNHGNESDWLIGGSFTGAGRVEVHEMATDNGVMRMRQLSSGLEIKPGQTVELKPGGYHLMFMELKQPTVEGAPVRGALTFRKAGTVEIEYSVAPIGAPAPTSSGGHYHHRH